MSKYRTALLVLRGLLIARCQIITIINLRALSFARLPQKLRYFANFASFSCVLLSVQCLHPLEDLESFRHPQLKQQKVRGEKQKVYFGRVEPKTCRFLPKKFKVKVLRGPNFFNSFSAWFIARGHNSYLITRKTTKRSTVHRMWPYIWWFPCQKYCIYTVYIYTVYIYIVYIYGVRRIYIYMWGTSYIYRYIYIWGSGL